LLLFTYLILALATAQIHYLETVHRVTFEKIFSENLFGSSIADVIATLGLFLLFLCLSFRHNAIKILSIAIFTVAIAAAGSGYSVQIAALTTVPIVAALLLVNIGLRGKWRKTQESPPIDIQKQKKFSRLELP